MEIVAGEGGKGQGLVGHVHVVGSGSVVQVSGFTH